MAGILESNETLDRFRNGPCEKCGRAGPTDPHHAVIRRGAGGGQRIDHPLNLVALCRECHRSIEEGSLADRNWCMATIADRESVGVQTVREYAWWLQRQPRGRRPLI